VADKISEYEFFAHYCDDYKEKLDQFKHFLKAQDVTIFHERIGELMIIFKNTYWIIAENGGELNILKINSPELMRSIAYTDIDTHLTKKILDVGTIGLRILSALKEEQIDWDFIMPDDVLLAIIG